MRDWGFRISDFGFRISDCGLRIADLGSALTRETGSLSGDSTYGKAMALCVNGKKISSEHGELNRELMGLIPPG